MLLCICMLIPQSGLAWGAQSGNRLKPDTEDLEIHVGEVFGSGGGVSSKDRSNLKLDEVWKDVTGKGYFLRQPWHKLCKNSGGGGA